MKKLDRNELNQRSKEELIQKGDALIKAANENGGKDNIAVVLVRLVEDDEVKE